MRHRLTDFDLAVLAAARMGVLTSYKKNEGNSAARSFWQMNGIDVMPSLLRLEQAGEICLTRTNNIIFTDSEAYADHVKYRDAIRELRRKIRSGEIKIPVIKKGP